MEPLERGWVWLVKRGETRLGRTRTGCRILKRHRDSQEVATSPGSHEILKGHALVSLTKSARHTPASVP